MIPLVSILIPAYNCEAWVGAAIRSALAQTWPNKEVIVLDDGSTDGTLDVIRSFGTDIQFESRRMGGQNRSRNRLTELSGGEWLKFLDADDELATDCIEKKMQYVDGADVIYGTIELATFSGNQKVQSRTFQAIEFDDPIEAAFEWRFPNTSATMFRREALASVGGWPEHVENCTDFALYFRLLLADRCFRAAPDAVSLYRHWSPTQAVFEKPLRLALTHLDLLWWAAQELESAGELTTRRRKAWSDRTLGAARTLYQHDKALARRYMARLYASNPGYRPRPPAFPTGYSLVYRWVGFMGAEEIAKLSRHWRRRLSWQAGSEFA
jgi:GT2 family glycosyltransferase